MVHSITRDFPEHLFWVSPVLSVGTQPWGKQAKVAVLMARTRLIRTLSLKQMCDSLSSKVCFYFDFVSIPEFVTKHKFVCPMYREAKQMEKLELGRERKVYRMAEQGEAYAPPDPKLPTGFSKAFLKVGRRRGVPGDVINSCTILWLVDGDQSLGTRRSRGYLLMIIK